MNNGKKQPSPRMVRELKEGVDEGFLELAEVKAFCLKRGIDPSFLAEMKVRV